jgi:hypothetical protein
LVTTSRKLVERFLEAGAGQRSLAGSAGFLGLRRRLAHDRGDAVFAYISPEFFRELTSPPIWIEAQRRARSQREATVVRLALLEAAAEGVAAQGIDDLVTAGLAPAGFARRDDASALAFDEAGAVDTRRGRVGFFIPAADVAANDASAAEAAAYRRFADRFRQEVGQMPPLGVAVKRAPLADGSGETMAAEIVALPLEGLKLGRLPQAFGPPSDKRVASVDGEVVRAEVVLDAPPLLPLVGGDAELHHLFVGVHDMRIPLVFQGGAIAAGAPRSELVRMYVGAWPKPGLLRLAGDTDVAEGPEPIRVGENGWQARADEFLVMSFKQDLIQEVLPQLEMVPAARPAQIWIDVGDLAGKDLAEAVNSLGYMRARETSASACRLMNTLANQLRVPRERCLEVGEALMDGTFVCALGGKYELVEPPGGLPVWTSTAITPENRFLLAAPPDDFQLPVLTWFKGLRGDFALLGDELSAHVEVDMAESAVP